MKLKFAEKIASLTEHEKIAVACLRWILADMIHANMDVIIVMQERAAQKACMTSWMVKFMKEKQS